MNVTVDFRSHAEEPFDMDHRNEHGELNPIDWAIVGICVRTAEILGIPRSTGEIFGLIFCSPSPISFDDVVRKLKISNGAASNGIRYLKRMGAVQARYVAQERKAFYVAEGSLRKLLSPIFSEHITHCLGGNVEYLERMRAPKHSKAVHDLHRRACIEKLIDWNQQLREAVSKGFESLH